MERLFFSLRNSNFNLQKSDLERKPMSLGEDNCQIARLHDRRLLNKKLLPVFADPTYQDF